MAKRPYLALAHPPPGSASEPTGAARTLIERAYAQLRHDIVEGVLAPGEKLRVEHLKAHYAVGAGTLREAITRLVSDALVVAEGQRGFRVAEMTIADLQDLTELRVHIEIDALRRSIRHGDEAWCERLRRAYEELSGVEQPIRPENRQRWELLNANFHEALISGQASAWTLRVLRTMARHGERYRRLSIASPDIHRDVHTEHRELYELAIARKEARAALALEAHIRNTPEHLIRAMGVDGVAFGRLDSSIRQPGFESAP